MSLLAAYVILYYKGVSPDGGVDTEASIVFDRGWSPRYPRYEGYSYDARGMVWNKSVHRFFTPIHQIDRILRKNLWLSAKEKQEKIFRATRLWPLKAPLQIYRANYVLDGGSIHIEGVDQRLTEFNIKLDRSLKTSRENLPQYIRINGRKLEYGGSEEQQLAIDLNAWLDHTSGDTRESTVRYVKEVVDAISNRT